jgi:putative two-component system hydrogenase maturation factor HypX/HoxX
MGLYGSEYWTYVLPRRVGADAAAVLTGRCLPIGARDAAHVGLVDDVVSGPAADFDAAVLDQAVRIADSDDHARHLERKRRRRAADERHKPLEAYRIEELAEMSRDLFDDRCGFAAAREAFVTKQKPSSTPARIALHRTAPAPTGGNEAMVRRAS